MKIGIIISTDDAEVVWNAFRLGVVSLKKNHKVKIFLINQGVEIENISGEKYNIKEQISQFLESNGKILACGTCLKSRNKEGSEVCPISTMEDLLKMIEDSGKVLTFG